jgi:DNA-binding beta-propeller fold protein YncE
VVALSVGAASDAGEVLVADRLTNSVYRYSESGALLGTLLTDNVNLNQPTGLAVSPDGTKLFVSSFQNSRVMRYDYDYAAGTATNPTIFAEGVIDNLLSPNAILFSQDGSRMYVSNLGGTGVAQFNSDGSTAAAPLGGSLGGDGFFQFSGLAYAPGGELLVSAFQDFPEGTSGAVARSDVPISTLSQFLGPAQSLNGASGLLVNGNDLYVSALFASNIQKFDVTTGAPDPNFTVSEIPFPQGLLAAPDGNGFLAAILGIVDGEGHIARYGFDGQLLEVFAEAGGAGFTEATAFIYVVPEPAGAALMVIALAALAAAARQRRLRGTALQ